MFGSKCNHCMNFIVNLHESYVIKLVFEFVTP